MFSSFDANAKLVGQFFEEKCLYSYKEVVAHLRAVVQ